VIVNATARTGHVPLAVPAAIGGAWLLAVVAQTSGDAALFDHGALAHSRLPTWAVVGLFLVAWQVMVAATMLPSSLPLIRLFTVASARQDRHGAVLAAFLGGYVLVWTSFGVLALAGDLALHQLVHRMPWLGARPWLPAAGALALAGAFQFSALKDRCLDVCRHPGVYLLHHYRRGVGKAFRLGRGHGLFCLGCCWALMLLMLAVGMANLAWMAVLAGLMAYEKAGRHGRRLAPAAGLVLLVLAVLVLAHPAWLPPGLIDTS
jgi:predicted metal-binding membrane protein